MSGHTARLVALAAALFVLAGSAVAGAETIGRENLLVSVTGKLSPHALPRTGTAPISVSVGWKIATTDESLPPDLKTLRIEINRNGRFNTTGLPVCPYGKIQPATSGRALANCHEALVGHGRFSAIVALEGQESYVAEGRLLMFNGVKDGKPVLFAQIYSPYPFANSFVITFSVSSAAHSTFGTVLTATLPPSLRKWGNLTGIDMTLSRRFGYKGQQQSYLTAGCPAPQGTALASYRFTRATFGFFGGTVLSTTLVRSCRVSH